MNETALLPPPAKDYNAARRQFVELNGSLAVMNTYLKIAVLLLSLVCLGLVWLNVKSIRLSKTSNRLLFGSMTSGVRMQSTTAASNIIPRKARSAIF